MINAVYGQRARESTTRRRAQFMAQCFHSSYARLHLLHENIMGSKKRFQGSYEGSNNLTQHIRTVRAPVPQLHRNRWA